MIKISSSENAKGKKIFIVTLVFEMISIIFAVILALAVDQWRENRLNRELAEESLMRIISEMNINRKNLHVRLNKNKTVYHTLRDNLRKMEKSDGESDLSLDLKLDYGIFRQSAWQTAIITQAVRYMEFGMVQELSVIYEIQDLLKSHQKSLLKSINSPALYSEDQKRILQYLQTILQDIKILNQMETDLLSIYTKFLDSQTIEIKKAKGKDT